MTLRNGGNSGRALRLSRRHFAAMAPAAVLGASGVLPRLVTSAAAQPATYNEAPVLAERVQAGQLPPVAERLPAEPLVVTPKAVGTYGGTMFGAAMAPETTSDLQVGMVAGLFRFSNDLSEAYPEIASGFEFNSDFTSCRITLRQGIKWSDGEPFTTRDMTFYFEDWQFHPELYPTIPGQWVVGGEPIGVTAVDDYTIDFTFAVPNPAFNLVHYSAAPAEPWRARHYLEQFHTQVQPKRGGRSDRRRVRLLAALLPGDVRGHDVQLRRLQPGPPGPWSLAPDQQRHPAPAVRAQPVLLQGRHRGEPASRTSTTSRSPTPATPRS